VRFRLLLLVVIGMLEVSGRAEAFTVNSGFTDPCHERFTMVTHFQTRVRIPSELIPDAPEGAWESFIKAIEKQMAISFESRGERFYYASLLAGVRANDTDGHSTLNLNALRSMHVHPEMQYEHFLRAQDDDYEQGNIHAIEMGREKILYFFELMKQFLILPRASQIIDVGIAMDFHGEVKIQVWAVAFFLGKALHTLQDSFSHTIRTDDMMRIIHVLNYVEAVGGGWEEERDGLRHSDAMDECGEEMGPVLEGVLGASNDLIFAAEAFIQSAGEDDLPVQVVLDKWTSYQEGCDMSNDYCDSVWAKRASEHPTLPYLESYFGCQSLERKGGTWLAMGILVTCLVFWGLRRRKCLTKK